MIIYWMKKNLWVRIEIYSEINNGRIEKIVYSRILIYKYRNNDGVRNY